MELDIFDEELIDLEFSNLKEVLKEEYSEQESKRIEYVLSKNQVIPHSKSHAKEIIKIQLKRIEGLSKKLAELYLKNFEGEEITDNIIDYIKNKITQMVNEEKAALKKREHFFGTLPNDFIRENIDEVSSKIISRTINSLLIEQKKQQKAKEKTIEEKIELFSFVKNAKFREIVTRDWIEIDKLKKIDAAKSILVMCGSLMEALLYDLMNNKDNLNLLQAPKYDKGKNKGKPKPIQEWGLSALLNVAEDNKLIEKGVYKESYVVCEYRRLIHPGREIRENIDFDMNDAFIAIGLLGKLIKNLKSINYS